MANNSTAILTVIGNGTSPVSQRYCSGASPLTIGLMTASFIMMGLLSLVGNVLIINVIRKNKLLRSRVDLLIVNMCVSDLCIPLLVYHLTSTNSMSLINGLMDSLDQPSMQVCSFCYRLLDHSLRTEYAGNSCWVIALCSLRDKIFVFHYEYPPSYLLYMANSRT